MFVLRSSDVQPSTALSGVRSSCDTVARNSSFRRFATSADSRAFCTASKSRALSMAIGGLRREAGDDALGALGEHIRRSEWPKNRPPSTSPDRLITGIAR